jgi:hypothetical protein
MLGAHPAPWRSGYAAACKAVYTGSIPVGASLRTRLSARRRLTALVSSTGRPGKRNFDARREHPLHRERFCGSKEAAVIDPMLVILAPPALVFGWAMIQMHSAADDAPERTPAKVDA